MSLICLINPRLSVRSAHVYAHYVLGLLTTIFILNMIFTGIASAQNIDSLQQRLEQQQQEIQALKARLDSTDGPDFLSEDHSNELDVSGFFDFTVHTTNSSKHPFDLGGLELDLQYDKTNRFALSTALVWSDEDTEVAAAVIDYHIYDHNVPVRGDIFSQPGFHLQMGRFDIPFGIDYVYFAAPDRPNVTAPLTTELILAGGLNGDGIRSYGTWSMIDYVFYLTNSVYLDDGISIGTRIGMFPAKDNFCMHRRNIQKEFVVGFSWLRDMDSEENERSTIYGFDLSWRLGVVELIYEFISLDSVAEVILPDSSSAGPADEEGYNIRLLFELGPASVYVGYGEWQPEYSDRLDGEDNSISYSVSKLERLTLGTQYMFNEYLQFKLEYIHHLDTETSEPDFEERKLTFQVVASF